MEFWVILAPFLCLAIGFGMGYRWGREDGRQPQRDCERGPGEGA